VSTPTLMTVGGGLGRVQPDVLTSLPTAPTGAAGTSLLTYAETPRFHDLDRLESYFRKRQDEHKRYDWDGHLMGYGDQADIKPGWYVPYKLRKPAARYDLAAVIVTRFTALLFGSDRFPELRVEGDEDAEDYIKALCEASRLPAKLIEGRNLGGAEGTSGYSFAFVNGVPRIEVHNAKHCTVTRWEDSAEHVVGSVIKAYAYPRVVYEGGKAKTKVFYYARVWDEVSDTVWSAIPKDLAESPQWWRAPSVRTDHGLGFTPFYWVQNTPDSLDPYGDGGSDYEGLCDQFDELNQLLSAVSKGTKSNVDPTLVIHDDPVNNTGSIRKGSENAIYSKGGAAYLEIKGEAVRATIELLERLRAYILDAASVVLPDPEKLSGAAQSAQALRILFSPMLAQADILREQYGEHAVKPMLIGMLRAARVIAARPPIPAPPLPDGTASELQPAVILPPRIVEGVPTERTPGTSEALTLNWNPYFSPTWVDIQAASVAATTANGGKPVVSQRTTVQALQSLWGVTDVDAEMDELHEESEKAIEQAQRAMAEGPNPPLESEEPTKKAETEGE